LGIPTELSSKNFGLKYRTVTKFNENDFHFFKMEEKKQQKTYKFACLIFYRAYFYPKKYDSKNMPLDLENYKQFMIPSKYNNDDKEIITAWCENSFGIVVRDEKNIAFLEEIFNAFKEKNICIGLFGDKNPFAGSSLTIAIKSKIPNQTNDFLKKSDLESFETKKLKNKWGKQINKISEKHEFISISPKFFDFFNKQRSSKLMTEHNTKYNYQLWINGVGSNYGWYTVEQFENWMKSENKELSEFKTTKK
jgi:hypothetical protein